MFNFALKTNDKHMPETLNSFLQVMSTVTMNHSFENMTSNENHCLFRLRAKAMNLGFDSYLQ